MVVTLYIYIYNVVSLNLTQAAPIINEVFYIISQFPQSVAVIVSSNKLQVPIKSLVIHH